MPIESLPNYAALQDYLFGLKQQGVKLGLDRMRRFVAALGHPERAVPVVHITGTNGKGSTSAMVEAILREAGWRVGLYTSPHLIRLAERIQVDRNSIRETEMLAHARDMLPVAVELGMEDPTESPSYFEFMTALAFRHFARCRCDIAVVEVGMGGRDDATNVVEPVISVITSVSLDHCDILGDTLTEIATAKAGIIKTGAPVVIGRLPEEAESRIRQEAKGQGASVFSVREDFGEAVTHYPKVPLAGNFQRWNAATASLVASTLPAEWGIDRAAITQGLRNTSWPARWQHVTYGGQPLILDSSHNAEGATVLAENLADLVAETGVKPRVIVGVLGAQRAKALLRTLSQFASEIILVIPRMARASSFAELRACISPDFDGAIVESSVDTLFPAIGRVSLPRSDSPVVVTGSIYLIAEVMTRLVLGGESGEIHLQDF